MEDLASSLRGSEPLLTVEYNKECFTVGCVYLPALMPDSAFLSIHDAVVLSNCIVKLFSHCKGCHKEPYKYTMFFFNDVIATASIQPVVQLSEHYNIKAIDCRSQLDNEALHQELWL